MMSTHRVVSDQLVNWSDHADPTDRRLAPTPRHAVTPTPAAEGDPAGLADRALQTLRQTGVPLRQGARAWPQVLSVGELPPGATADGVRAAGVSRTDDRVRGQLPAGPRDPRADLRDQSRTAAPTRGALTRRHGPGTVPRPHPDRRGRGRSAARQYARRLARPRSSGGFAGGGR